MANFSSKNSSTKLGDISSLFKSLYSMYKNFLSELSNLVGKSTYIFESRALLEATVYIIGSGDEKLEEIIIETPCRDVAKGYNREIVREYIPFFRENMELAKKILCLGSDNLISSLLNRIDYERMTFHLLVIIHILFNTAMQKVIDYTSDLVLDSFIGKVIENISEKTWEILVEPEEERKIKDLVDKGDIRGVVELLANVINRRYKYKILSLTVRDDMKPKCITFKIDCPYARKVHITDRENWGICTYALFLSTLLRHLDFKITYIGSKMERTGSRNLVSIE
ncbi:MAG: hypothetical protein ACP6IP_03215 [Candidatus Njordarchaeia archaeon]